MPPVSGGEPRLVAQPGRRAFPRTGASYDHNSSDAPVRAWRAPLHATSGRPTRRPGAACGRGGPAKGHQNPMWEQDNAGGGIASPGQSLALAQYSFDNLAA